MAHTPHPARDDPWFDRAFAADYADLYRHRDLAAARDEVRGLVERGLAGPLLDLGCGFGRHAVALCEMGLRVFGLDRSADLLAQARQREGADLLRGRLVRGDFRALPYAESSFHAVVMLFSSFGYFDDATNERVLGEAARVLGPGGTLVLDLMNAERIRATLVPESVTERDGRVLREVRRLTEGGRRVRKDVTLEEPEGARRSWHEDVRLYDRGELEPLLGSKGLTLQRLEGDFDGRPLTADAPRCILWARRREG